MILRQFLHTSPAVAISYLVGCGGRGLAAIVDPVGDIEPYLHAAETGNMRIAYVIDTHIHADHVSSAPALLKATDAEYVLFAGADVGYSFRGVRDGELISLGNVEIGVMHTPGHTPEHISLLVYDHTRSDEPWFVLTGHTFMVGDLGRTELATSAEVGARDLYFSSRKLSALADHVEVLPGAFAGSVCGRALSGKPGSTIGFEKRFNKALQLADESDFIAFMTRDIPPPPPDAAHIREINAGRGQASIELAHAETKR
ncbi:MAG TPA: MBL fold metallo-hydrolase [Acidobacteriaceae bacterium]|jgi:glyoxylase-like metal-dependent hydrolase (beta-lactamase superfamily II)